MKRRKLCRAFGCVKRIFETELFCAVHFPMLQHTRFAAPIADNREATVEDPTAVRRVASGVADARAWLAGKEGKAARLQAALNAQPSQDPAVTQESFGEKPGDIEERVNHY